jgi:hypothetical protein
MLSLVNGKAGPEAVNQYRLAAEAADSLTTAGNNKKRVAAYTYYASALILENRSKEAPAYAQKAVAASDLGFIDISDKAIAYGLRGQASGLARDPHGARSDLAKVEELERTRLRFHAPPSKRNLIQVCSDQWLAGLGETTEADKLRHEAWKL